MLLAEWDLTEIPHILHWPCQAYGHKEHAASCFWPSILHVKIIIKACKTTRVECFQKPSLPSVISNSQQLLSLFFPSLFTIRLGKKKSTFKKILKTENSKATSGNWEALCCYQSQLVLGRLPKGTKFSLQQGPVSADPLWMSQVSHAINSISAICLCLDISEQLLGSSTNF